MAQYEKLINLGLLSQFLTKAKTIFAPKITASGILKGDGAGNVSAATAGTDYVTPAQSLALGLTGASVGDLVRVNAVDSNGKPTSWKHVPLNEIKCNHNYAENWDFTNPINQRGQQSYSTTGYCIDRWWRIFGVTTIVDGGISYSVGATEAYSGALRQALSDPKKFAGKTVTISALVDEITGGNVAIACIKSSGMNSGMAAALVTKRTTSPGVLTTTGTIPDDVGSNTYPLLMMAMVVDKGTTVKIRAVKFELGSEQTLCHNEGTAENPVWVLNESPDYLEELRKCQRYFVRLSGNTNFIASGFVASASAVRGTRPMQKMAKLVPSVTVNGTIYVQVSGHAGGGSLASTAVEEASFNSDSLFLYLGGMSNLTGGQGCLMQFRDNTSHIDISAEP